MHSDTQIFEGGFSDSVLNAQSVFRALMDAMANPGWIVDVSDLAVPPAPLTSLAASIAATLFDHDATVWCDRAISGSAACTGWLKFHTGLELTDDTAEADFALISDVATMPSLESFCRGTSEYPDRSTTLILQIDGFDGADALVLEGPGIKDSMTFSPSQLPKMFIDQWIANRAAFPRGVDLIFAGKGALAALPRTTRIKKTEA